MLMKHCIQKCCTQESMQNLMLSLLVFVITFLTSTYFLAPKENIEQWLHIQERNENNYDYVTRLDNQLFSTEQAPEQIGTTSNPIDPSYEGTPGIDKEYDVPSKPTSRQMNESKNPSKPNKSYFPSKNIRMPMSKGGQPLNRKKIGDWASERLARKEKMLGMTFDHGDEGNCTKSLPQAIIIGVMECGTEPLTTFLAIHPDIAMQMKLVSVEFFNKNYNKATERYDWYRNQMPCSSEGQVTIEKSPQYFASPYVPKRVWKMDKDVKLILLVRDPIKRAMSHYEHLKSLRHGKLPDSFEETIMTPMGDIDFGHELLQRSLYSIQLRRWLNYFKMDQIHIVDGDNFILNPADELNKIEKFLGIRQYFTQSLFIYNKDTGFFCLYSQEFGGPKACLLANQGRKHRDISPDVLERLKMFYKPYNEEFFEITGQYFAWDF